VNQQTQKSLAPSTEQILPRSRSSVLRILVVDDQPDWRDLLATFLRLKGHSVRDAASGSDAMRICFKFSPDIVFVDIRMPDMDGFELCARLRQNTVTQNAAVYALTAYPPAVSSSDARRLGFNAYLLKPVHLEAITCLLSSRSETPVIPEVNPSPTGCQTPL
jgi:CheY-like chemotaxis protein